MKEMPKMRLTWEQQAIVDNSKPKKPKIDCYFYDENCFGKTERKEVKFNKGNGWDNPYSFVDLCEFHLKEYKEWIRE